MKKITPYLLCLFSLTVFSQKLEKSKTHLKKKDLNIEVNSSSSSVYEEDDDSSFGEVLFVDLVAKPIIFLAKVVTLELFIESYLEKDGKHPYMELTPHPYLDNLVGDYTYNSTTYKPIRLDISNQLVFDAQNIMGNNLNAKFRFLQRGSIEYNQLYLYESIKGKTSQLFLHDITANYYRIRTNSFSLHYGLGASYVHSSVNKAYFTYKMGFQYFFKIPLSLEVEHRGTLITNDGVYQTNLGVNYYYKNYALKAGIQFYDIGNVNYQMFAFGGKVYL
ncbi:hypothetical protein [Wenyingzhuangia aestuarii]|uniref:hypothetical protein n=1 Tax=Wenyingzhuangia aestuarii TaxID=1647582 RepID=UPI001439BBEC|nr:hypothetical protein [Wenyingzhuangia aestuarii]NJB81411.1 hypothetical protein [Wenyingzhuangia aestuarii]